MSKKNFRRIAFLGGAFDPPHLGHAMLAKRVLELDLSDLVLWVPSWAPPHKCAGNMSDFFHRLAMAGLAAEEIPGCAVSDIEERRKFDPSYSFRVLGALAEENPDAELQLLIGQDSLEQLHTWYCAKELVSRYDIIAFPRRGGGTRPGEDLVLPEEFWGHEAAEKLRNSLIPGEYVEISSTILRKELAKNANVQHIINAKVLEYIEKNALYR
ncbi:MAG: nicotinate (nicotinamide) nucleotide adenylyltransferase [Lentisphaerae bacterium]|nr:nicotinate (nicotinamide) nucleotide adenylyltransferase [Lentisphaerota bacterium]